jgi:hypothetical protein
MVKKMQKSYDLKSAIAGAVSFALFISAMIFFAITNILAGFSKEIGYVVIFSAYFVIFLGAGYYFTYNSTAKWIRVVGTVVIAFGICIPGILLTFLLMFAQLR